MRSERRIFSLIAVLALCAAQFACGVQDVARTVRIGGHFAAREFAAEVESGDVSKADGDRLSKWAGEVGDAGGKLEQSAAGWKTMTKAQKRLAVADFIVETSAAQARLDAAGAPVFKSPKARKTYNEVQQNLRRARDFLSEFTADTSSPQ